MFIAIDSTFSNDFANIVIEPSFGGWKYSSTGSVVACVRQWMFVSSAPGEITLKKKNYFQFICILSYMDLT